MGIEESVKNLVEKPIMALGYDKIEVKYVKEFGTQYLRILVDRDDVIDLEDIVKVNDLVSPLLDEADLIHQDRAISIREAALLQTFPMDYKFFPNEEEVSITKASRYIGNAVPPRLGEVIADSIKEHIRTHR